MKMCKCGDLVEDHVRFHFARPHEENQGSEAAGHYVEDDKPPEVRPAYEEEERLASWPPNIVRSSMFFGAPTHVAPPPGPVPDKPWGNEESLRRAGSDLMKSFGFAVYDLEQGHRSDGSSRVAEGIGDTYFHGDGIRGWIEWKRWDNEPSEKQRAFGLEELAQGGIYLLIYETAQLVTWNQLRRRS